MQMLRGGPVADTVPPNDDVNSDWQMGQARMQTRRIARQRCLEPPQIRPGELHPFLSRRQIRRQIRNFEQYLSIRPNEVHQRQPRYRRHHRQPLWMLSQFSPAT